ncbi:hypothetical protein PIB30_048745 [Stylosanthes scabra]|uniref:Uncharacterized protein n=1 Tax=Stylosanthes scabra TaxID=79078 RepID=A0ABU6ZFW5_9FABA|nr:hypothetical protein [Stylosanthes scabra]
MPRVGRFGRPRKRGGNKPSIEEPSPLSDSPPPSQDPPPTIDPSSSFLPPSTWLDATSSAEALLQAPPATHSWLRLRQFLDAFSEVPPSSVGPGAPSSSEFPPPSTDARTLNQTTSTLNDITTSMEAPLYAPSATQTRPRSRQYKESPSQVPRHSTNAPPSTHASPPSTDAAPSMETPSQVQPTIRTRLQRRQHMETSSQTPPPSIDAPPSVQAPPLSTDAPPPIQVSPPSTNATQPIHAPLDAPLSSQVPPPSFDAPPFTPTSSTSVDDTSSPERSSHAQPATRIQHRRRECKRNWTVDVIDASGATKVVHLKLKDLWKLRDGTKVVVPFDDSNQPVGEAGSLLAMAIAKLGADFTALPICYKSWLKVPKHYKEEIYNSKIKEKFIINSNIAKKMIIGRIGDKWRANRTRIFRRYYDPKLSREQNYLNHPPNITLAQWTWFIDYRLDPNTDQMCKRNAEIRGRSAVVPRGEGEPKLLARKRFEMEEVESEEPVGRGKVSVATRANVDGSFANEATKSSCEKRIRSENGGSCPQAIPLDDSLGQVMGKESLARVRGSGSGPCPTPAFRTKEDCCLNSDVLAKMQKEIADLRAQLEKETKSRIEFQKDVSLILQNVATPVMTPELAALLTPLLTRALQAASANYRNGS